MTSRDSARSCGYLDGLHRRPNRRLMHPPFDRWHYDQGHRDGVRSRIINDAYLKEEISP